MRFDEDDFIRDVDDDRNVLKLMFRPKNTFLTHRQGKCFLPGY